TRSAARVTASRLETTAKPRYLFHWANEAPRRRRITPPACRSFSSADGACTWLAVFASIGCWSSAACSTAAPRRTPPLPPAAVWRASRRTATAALAAGRVTADDVVVAKPSEEISADAILRAEPAHPYVSRGGVKLAAALDHFRFDPMFDPRGRVCLDVGASTG